MSTAVKAAVLTDPRRPNEVQYLSVDEKKKLDAKSAESEHTNELMLVMAFAVGMGSIMSKMKLGPWVALFLCFPAMADWRWGVSYGGQMALSLVVVAGSFLACYLPAPPVR